MLLSLPEAEIVTLTQGGGREVDQISFLFPRDFKMVDPGAYALPSELVLNRSR